jgi:hypothetical protein
VREPRAQGDGVVLLCTGAELIFIVGATARSDVLRVLFGIERAADVTHVRQRNRRATLRCATVTCPRTAVDDAHCSNERLHGARAQHRG